MKNLKVGLVGCGFMGRMHGEVYGVVENTTLKSVFDLNKESAQTVGAPHSAAILASYDEMLADPEIDIIDICLPTHLHADFTIRALEAGKHVFCEKPMARSVEEADQMIEVAKKTGKKLMIGHCIRFWQEYAILKKLVDGGTLGKLTSINLTRYGAFPSWSSEGWLGKEELSGGAALDMHIHDTDYALYLLGKPRSMRSSGTVDSRGTSQIFTTMLYDGTIAHTEGGWNLPNNAPFKMAFRAIFERGAAIFDAGPLTIYEDGKDPVVPEIPKMAAKAGGNISDLGGYYLEIDYFVKSILNDTPLEIVTPESSKESLIVALEEINMAKETFAGALR